MSHLLKAATQGVLHTSLQRRFMLVILAALAFHLIRLQSEMGASDAFTEAMGAALQFVKVMGAMMH